MPKFLVTIEATCVDTIVVIARDAAHAEELARESDIDFTRDLSEEYTAEPYDGDDEARLDEMDWFLTDGSEPDPDCDPYSTIYLSGESE